MLRINKLSLYHFKNYITSQFVFSKRIICIYGPNGSGKTSILDAIYWLCFTKSYFQHMDANCISKNEIGMRIHGQIMDEKLNEVVCIIRENGKKELILNDEVYHRFSSHIGRFPCVFITPDDTELITDGSETRRKFLDSMISQINHSYLEQLIRYNKCLQQRNALLKGWQSNYEKDFSLLMIYSKKLDELGTSIFEIRKRYCLEYSDFVKRIYLFLCDESEDIDIAYHSRLENDTLLSLLDNNIDKDILSQRTNYGIHKDDLIFSLTEMPLKQVASQGQRKSFLFALKLAQFELIKKYSCKNPILLLDDLFEKLDEKRSAKLIHYIMNESCQVFITDTHEERLTSAFGNNMLDVEFLVLKRSSLNE